MYIVALYENMSYFRKRYRIKIAFSKILILCQIQKFLFCRFDTVAKKKDVCTSTISSTKGPYKLCLIILFSIQNFIVKIETMLSLVIINHFLYVHNNKVKAFFKGQLISKCPFGVFKSTKNNDFLRIPALASIRG